LSAVLDLGCNIGYFGVFARTADALDSFFNRNQFEELLKTGQTAAARD
jgi:hypothetical protein